MIDILTSVEDVPGQVPQQFSVMDNYPNPFNPSTTIKFAVPKSSHVRIDVYNSAGQKIQTLTDQRLSPGTYEAIFNGSNLASGVYIYRMVSGDFTAVKKMILMK